MRFSRKHTGKNPKDIQRRISRTAASDKNQEKPVRKKPEHAEPQGR